jgi:hypothetical protein
MMVVIQPDTPDIPGYTSLGYTTRELEKIEARMPTEWLVRLGIPGAPAFVKEVVSHLPTASIVHFACHGEQNTLNPLDSALILQDGKLKVSQIMELSLRGASLAVLSACKTAMGDENLPDEVIHLGASLLFVGFRGVVATMWYVNCVALLWPDSLMITYRSMSDVDGPEIMDTFYENLFRANPTSTDPTADTMQAARALHLAVSKLRAKGVPFIRWVPFVHLGL